MGRQYRLGLMISGPGLERRPTAAFLLVCFGRRFGVFASRGLGNSFAQPSLSQFQIFHSICLRLGRFCHFEAVGRVFSTIALRRHNTCSQIGQLYQAMVIAQYIDPRQRPPIVSLFDELSRDDTADRLAAMLAPLVATAADAK